MLNKMFVLNVHCYSSKKESVNIVLYLLIFVFPSNLVYSNGRWLTFESRLQISPINCVRFVVAFCLQKFRGENTPLAYLFGIDLKCSL